MIRLRPYQQQCIAGIYAWFSEHTGNCLAVCPTGSGKSLIIADFVKGVMQRWPDQRVLMLTHRMELIAQNAERLLQYWPEAPIGIYSAGLRQRVGFMPITFAGIQSVYNKAHQLGRYDLVLIDEAHLVSTKQTTTYRRFLADAMQMNPALKVVGFTATPMRLDSGFLHTGEGALFDGIAYEIGILELIEQGYLCPLITKAGHEKLDLSAVKTRGGEFVMGDVAKAGHDIAQAAASEIATVGEAYQHWLIFCSNIEHAEEMAELLRALGVACEAVHSKLSKEQRASVLRRFSAGELRAVVNAEILTVGYDFPGIDLLVMLRPTKSVALYQQICGRGMRIAPGKTHCRVLDFSGNVERHGPVDAVRIRDKRPGESGGTAPGGKECPRCHTVVSVFARSCDCGHRWPFVEKPPHATTATEAAILSSQVQPEWHHVDFVRYRRHQKSDRPDSLRVDYACGIRVFSEWVCVEHEGFAKAKADRWIQKRLGRAVATVSEALEHKHQLWEPVEILIRRSRKFDEVIDYRFGESAGGTHARSPQSAGAGANEIVSELFPLS